MNIQKCAVYFVFLRSDNLIIPCFDVSKCQCALLNEYFLDDWYKFIKELQAKYVSLENSKKILLDEGFQILNNEKYTCFLPQHWKGGFIKNFPNLYGASHNQILDFLKSTKITLDTVKITNSEDDHLVQTKINPTTFCNLIFTNSTEILSFAKEQKSSSRIFISILCWWNYRSENDQSMNEDLVEIIENYCVPMIFQCDKYIAVFARFLILKNFPVVKWFDANFEKIIWCEDLLSDTPTHSIYECCEKLKKNVLFFKEMQRRGI